MRLRKEIRDAAEIDEQPRSAKRSEPTSRKF
jgi:hypothetical protein